MTDKEQIQSLLKEAGIYQKQGLLKESKEKYSKILELVESEKELSDDRQLISLVRNKVKEVDSTLDEVEGEPDTVELSEEVRDLIGKLFSFSENEDTAAVESAVALATFGQYEKALIEFQKLLDKRILPMVVAKNMLQCHQSLGSHQAAISQLEDWISHSAFPGEELSRLRGFLGDILARDGIEADLPDVKNEDDASSGEETSSESKQSMPESDFSAILSVKLILDDKHSEDQTRDFDVEFQLGNSVTINIENSEKDLLRVLEHGASIPKIQCYSSFYFFNAKGIVAQKKVVTIGPNEGDFAIVLILKNP